MLPGWDVTTCHSVLCVEIERKCEPNEAKGCFARMFLAGVTVVEDWVRSGQSALHIEMARKCKT